MIACLKEVDPLVSHSIYQPVLLTDAPRPAALKHIAKRLGLPGTRKRVTHHCAHEVKQPQSQITIGFDPVSKVFEELLLKYGDTFYVTGHSGSLASVHEHS